jgi:peptide deformylase
MQKEGVIFIMAVYQIVKMGEDILREKAQEVKKISPNIIRLLDNLADTLYESKGVGLAAPQIGVSKRVAVVDIGEELFELINPVIIEKYGEEVDEEGCLSIPGLQGEVKRAAKVVVECLNREGEQVKYVGEGFLARAFQHEIDHLNGILFVDLCPKVYKV